MDSIISGTFRMIIRRGFPHQLYFDEDFMRIIGTEDNSDPEKNYRLWEECVHPDDMPLVKEAIESTQHNIPNYPAGQETSESLNVAIATAVICAEFRRQAAWK